MKKLLGFAALALAIGCSGSDDPAGAGDAGSSGGSAGGGAGGTGGTAGGASGSGGSGAIGGADAGSDAKPAPSQMAKQVSRNGFTWTFDTEYQAGQYVNGDYWVVDPGGGIGITSVTPAPTGSGGSLRNGSMVNPVNGDQGYDGRVSKFSDSVSVSFPTTLTNGQSLVSMESRGSASDCPSGGLEDISGYCVSPGHGFLLRASALTAVSEVPPADAFRPSFSGDKKTSYYAGNLKRSLLPKLALGTRPAASVVAESATHFQHPWVDHRSGWTGRAMHPIRNMPNYGREIGKIVSRGALLLMLDYTDAELEPLLINYVQLGIDLQGMSEAGTSWHADGGHGNARKWPILFAGIMLDQDALKNSAVVTGEDGHTYFGTVASKNAGQDKVALFGADCTSSYQANGCSGSGSKDCRDPAGAIDACSDYRNCCTSRTWVGEALAARIMGAAPLWKNDAFFDYVDRWMGYGADPPVVGGGGITDPFIGDAWKAHRASYP